MTRFSTLGMMLFLAGCGGVHGFKGDTRHVPRIAPMATGPISTACLTSDRKARSRALCGCIQAVANETLSGSEQRRAVQFYSDPQSAQDTRQSNRSGDERFWRAYTAYSERADLICR
ncbi:hypothetical protein [uncultured Roseovarius sp.]|uniref:hypothetical protein n=1 Tax=Roseovarius sp. TaxID=1486281 RepID=UPI0025EA282D|nr:hypothetical protein [uncultured Roseovarius sp.]